MNQSQNDSLSQTMAIRHYIELMNHQELIHFLNENKISQSTLNTALTILTQNYSKTTQFLDMLNILLTFGADINTPIVFQKGSMKIEEKDKITLVMFSIMRNDIELLQLLLNKLIIEINQQDAKKRNAIIYSIIYDNNDNDEIVKMLIKAKADIDTVCKIEIGTNPPEVHSVFTYAISKNLLRIVEVLIDNHVNVNYQMKSNKDTGLHIAVKKDYVNMVGLLLKSKSIFVDQINDEKMKPVDIAKIRNNDAYALFCQYYANEREKKTAVITPSMQPMNEMKSNVAIGNNSNSNSNAINMNMNHMNGSSNNIGIGMGMTSSNMGMMNMNNDNALNMNDIPHNSQIDVENNNSVQSSDVGENVDEEDKTQGKPGKNNNTHCVLSNKAIELLKKKLTCTLSQKTQSNQYLEIGIDFRKDIGNSYIQSTASSTLTNSNYNLESFLRITNPPTLCLDLTDKSYELELQYYDSIKQTNEKDLILKQLEEKIQEKEKKLKELSDIYKTRDNDLNNLIRLEDEQNKKIIDLNRQIKESMTKITGETAETPTKKNISIKEYRNTKFSPVKYDESKITKILQKDLIDYRTYIVEQISKKKHSVDQLILNVQKVVNETSQDYEVRLYGSYATGLCLPWSDLDIVLVNVKGGTPDSLFLSNLYYRINTKNWVKVFKFIETATIPIIKIISSDEFNNMQMDISVQNDKHFGLQCVALIKSYLKEYEVLEPLILALKTILKNANLNDPYFGGLSSYGLILMVVSYIQNQIDNDKYSDVEDKVGKTYYHFLKHYGIYFDFNKYVILTYPIKDTNTSVEKDNTLSFVPNTSELIIVDPLNKQNNVAKSSFQFMNLKMAFMIAFMVTNEDCECGCHYGRATHEHTHFSTEHCILKRMFNSVKRFPDTKI